jgi:hypothetical protein
VAFHPEAYGSAVADLLALRGGGSQPMPLVRQSSGLSDAQARLKEVPAVQLFPAAQSPEAALAGLYLYFSCWEDAHSAADSIEDANGYFWHAIVHRQEPDPANSAYWFRKTGTHAVFPQLNTAAAARGYMAAGNWDPFAFIDFCETARRRPGSKEEQMAIKVQLAEWQLLFDYCARGRRG